MLTFDQYFYAVLCCCYTLLWRHITFLLSPATNVQCELYKTVFAHRLFHLRQFQYFVFSQKCYSSVAKTLNSVKRIKDVTLTGQVLERINFNQCAGLFQTVKAA